LIALEIQKRLDEGRNRRERKLSVLRRLMTTRATDISPAHVEALNSIEVEFYATKGPDKKVLDAWRIYINHVNKPMEEGSTAERWVETRKELLVNVVYEMGQSLGYDIDRVAIKNNVYYPKGQVDVEMELHALRKAALKVFTGGAPVVTSIVGPVEVIPPLKPPDALGLRVTSQGRGFGFG
jgi:hypothetical protein